MGLRPKQQFFVDEYLIDFNATQAAIRAGYSAKTAEAIGLENLGKPLIAAAIKLAVDARKERTEITQDKVLTDIEAIKQDAMQKVADDDGSLVMVNHTAALKACELQGKHLLMFGSRLEVTGKNGGAIVTKTERDLTDEELAAELAKYGIEP